MCRRDVGASAHTEHRGKERHVGQVVGARRAAKVEKRGYPREAARRPRAGGQARPATRGPQAAAAAAAHAGRRIDGSLQRRDPSVVQLLGPSLQYEAASTILAHDHKGHVGLIVDVALPRQLDACDVADGDAPLVLAEHVTLGHARITLPHIVVQPLFGQHEVALFPMRLSD